MGVSTEGWGWPGIGAASAGQGGARDTAEASAGTILQGHRRVWIPSASCHGSRDLSPLRDVLPFSHAPPSAGHPSVLTGRGGRSRPLFQATSGVRSPLLQRGGHSVSEGEPRAAQRGGSTARCGGCRRPWSAVRVWEQPLTAGQLSYPGGPFQEFTARSFPAGSSWAANPAFVCTFPGAGPAWRQEGVSERHCPNRLRLALKSSLTGVRPGPLCLGVPLLRQVHQERGGPGAEPCGGGAVLGPARAARPLCLSSGPGRPLLACPRGPRATPWPLGDSWPWGAVPRGENSPPQPCVWSEGCVSGCRALRGAGLAVLVVFLRAVSSGRKTAPLLGAGLGGWGPGGLGIWGAGALGGWGSRGLGP